MEAEVFRDRQIVIAEQSIKEKTFWLDNLSGKLVKSCFPYDFAGRENPGNRDNIAVVSFDFSGQLFKKLMSASGDSPFKLHIVLMTGIILLLDRYTGNRDIVVSTPIYKPDVEGKFVNTILPLRVPVEGSKTFREMLKQVGKILVEASEHQNYPIELLLEQVDMPLVNGEPSLLDTAVVVQNIHNPEHIRPIQPKLIFSFLVTEDSIKGNVEYPPVFYLEGTIDGIIRHLTLLLNRATAQLETPVSALDMVSTGEREQLLFRFNSPPLESSGLMDKTIVELFEARVAKVPDRPAAAWNDATLTYRALQYRASHLARLLISREVKPGAVVGLEVERSLETIVAIMAILEVGGVCLPISPGWDRDRKRKVIEENQPVVFLALTQGSVIEGVNTVFIDDEIISALPALAGTEGPFPSGYRSSGAGPGFVIYTPGTTGVPKGVMIEQGNIINVVNGMNEAVYRRCGENLVFSLVSPLGSGVSLGQLFGALLLGHCLEMVPGDLGLEGSGLHRFYRERSIDISDGTPAHIALLSACSPGIPLELPVKHFIIGGAILSKETAGHFFRRFKTAVPKISYVYGSVESSGVSCVQEISRENIEQFDTLPIGRPLVNQRAYILDGRGELLPAGVTGLLCIGGGGVARGYVDQAGFAGENFSQDPFFAGERLFKTGDLARWLPDGSIEFMGRAACRVRVKGVPTTPETIEKRLLKHADVSEAVVIAKNGGEGNEDEDITFGAYFVSRRQEAVPALREYLSGILPDYLVPASYVQLETMPLTARGRIDRDALLEVERHLQRQYASPRDSVEETLADIWSDVLEMEKDGIRMDMDFSVFGGQSLKAIMMATRIHKAFNISIPIPVIFELPTILGLAEYIREKKIIKPEGREEKGYASIEPTEKKEYYALSPAQKRLYLLQQMDAAGIGYNVPQTARLGGDLNRGRIEKALNQLIDRHETLRTSFEMVGDVPVQVIHPPGELAFAVEYYELEGGNRPNKEKSFIDDFVRPFDLSRAPLFRVGLIKRDESQYIIMIDRHHIISDATSRGIFIKELMTLYEGHDLPGLRLQYKDYSQWQNSDVQREALKQQEAYWLEQFEGEIPVLNLPTDYPRPPLQRFDGRYILFGATSEETEKLKAIAAVEEATLFMVLLAVYTIFLYRVCGQEDIVVGSPVVGRRHADMDHIMGVFINTLALRNQPGSAKTFNTFLKEVKSRSLGAFENQMYPFEELVEKVSVNRDISRSPLFDTILILHPTSTVKMNDANLSVGHYHYETTVSNFDLVLQVEDTGENLLFPFGYSTKLFKESTVWRFARIFKKIMAEVIVDSERTLGSLEIIPGEEKTQVLFDFNRTEREYPEWKTLHELFEEQVDRSPDRIAVVGGEQGLSLDHVFLSYRRLDEEANQLARRIRQKGVPTEKTVGLIVNRSIEMIAAILGILKAGGGYLPIDPLYPLERIKYMLEDSGIGMLITESYFQEKIKELAFEGETIDLTDESLHREDKNRLANVNTSRHLAYLIYTSGSTGKPKGIMIEHRNVVNFITGMVDRIPFKEGRLILALTTISFDIFVLETWVPLSIGMTVVIANEAQQNEPDLLNEAILNHRIDMMQVTPSRLNLMIIGAGDEAFHFLGGIKDLIVGGEAFPTNLFEELRKNFSSNVYNLYGPTETTVWSTLKNMGQPGEITIGKPIANTQIYILNQNDRLQPIGISGELCIGGDGVGRGYVNNPELTNSKFQAPAGHPLSFSASQLPSLSLYRTGDLARWMPDGSIEFLGRSDHQVKLRGFRIELKEIERQLLKHPVIKETVVLCRTDENSDKYLCAYIALNNAPSPPISELKEYLSRVLPNYMIPSYFVEIEEVPLTPNGKVARNTLPEPGASIDREYAPPRDDVEKKLVEIWGEVLDGRGGKVLLTSIGINDNFFHLGGHSMTVIAMTSKIHKALNVKVPLAEVFRIPTIKGLSKYIKGLREDRYAAIEPVEKKHYYVLSSAQRRLYALHHMDVNSTRYNMPKVRMLEGTVDRERLASVFEMLIRRHESFRTSFFVKENEPVQGVHDEVSFEIDFYDVSSKPGAADPNERAIVENFIRPFDLSRAPLFRVGLIKLAEERHILMVDIHHIVYDGTSIQIFEMEFRALYAGRELPGLRIQYRDFAQWQDRLISSGEIKRQEDFWLNRFKGDVPVLNMPMDYPRPPIYHAEGSSISFELTREISAGIKKLVLRTGTTLYMVLLAAYYILLSKYSGQEDIVVGTPIAGRRHSDLENIIGLFANMLAMRNQPRGGKIFLEFLVDIKKNSLDAYENQDYQFESLAWKLKLKVAPGRNPLFDAVFVLQNFNVQTIQESDDNDKNEKSTGAGINVFPYKIELGKVHHELLLNVVEEDRILYMELQYSTELYKESTIRKISEHYIEILEQIIENPDVRLRDIKISHALLTTGTSIIQEDEDDFRF